MMGRFLFITGILIVFSCASAWCSQDDWVKQFGQDLANAPLTVRQKFVLVAGQSWQDASFEERLKFLNDLEAQEMQRAQEKKRQEEKTKQEKLVAEQKKQAQLQAVKAARDKEKAKADARAQEKAANADQRQALSDKRRALMEKAREKARAKKH